MKGGDDDELKCNFSFHHHALLRVPLLVFSPSLWLSGIKYAG